jgi:hypothetical protein
MAENESVVKNETDPERRAVALTQVLQNYCGHLIQDIGSLDLSHTL